MFSESSPETVTLSVVDTGPRGSSKMKTLQTPATLTGGTVLTNGGLCWARHDKAGRVLCRVRIGPKGDPSDTPDGSASQAAQGPAVVPRAGLAARVAVDGRDVLRPTGPVPPLPPLPELAASLFGDDTPLPITDAIFMAPSVRAALPCHQGLVISLQGPRGCGKTTFAAALGRHYQREAGSAFRVFSARDVAAKRTDASLAALDAEIAWAVRHQPSLLVLDDLDAVCAPAGQTAEGGGTTSKTADHLCRLLESVVRQNPLVCVVCVFSESGSGELALRDSVDLRLGACRGCHAPRVSAHVSPPLRPPSALFHRGLALPRNTLPASRPPAACAAPRAETLASMLSLALRARDAAPPAAAVQEALAGFSRRLEVRAERSCSAGTRAPPAGPPRDGEGGC